MKIERKILIVEGCIKASFLTLCGILPYFYINYDTILSYTDWRADIIRPIIWVDGLFFIGMCLAYIYVARKEK